MGCVVTETLGRLVALGLPSSAREEVTGDLLEEGLRPETFGHLRALTGVVLHVQAEPYRNPESRFWLIGALGGAFLVWFAVITARFEVLPELLPLWDPVSRSVLRFWSASHVTAGLAAGLVLGRLPGGPSVGPARAHAVFLLAAVAGYQGGVGWSGAAAVASVVGAAWIGSRARREAGLPRRA